jgi:HPt (histidine-containing phosphotransfer) domain-containing protein
VNDADLPVLDESVLDELGASVGGDRDFVVDLIEAYLADGGQQVEQVEAAISGTDTDALVRPAHTLKSSSATVGASRLAAMARELEFAGREGRVDDAQPSHAAALRAEWEAASAALREWTSRSGA